jgi:LPXTG-motif cell wall-anchored protein
VEFGVDATWTVAETLNSELPQPSSAAPWALILGGVALLALALILFLRKKGSGKPPEGQQPSPAEEQPLTVEETA